LSHQSFSFFPDKNRLVSLGIAKLKSWISDNELNMELEGLFVAGPLDKDRFYRPPYQRSSVFGDIQENGNSPKRTPLY